MIGNLNNIFLDLSIHKSKQLTFLGTKGTIEILIILKKRKKIDFTELEDIIIQSDIISTSTLEKRIKELLKKGIIKRQKKNKKDTYKYYMTHKGTSWFKTIDESELNIIDKIYMCNKCFKLYENYKKKCDICYSSQIIEVELYNGNIFNNEGYIFNKKKIDEYSESKMWQKMGIFIGLLSGIISSRKIDLDIYDRKLSVVQNSHIIELIKKSNIKLPIIQKSYINELYKKYDRSFVTDYINELNKKGYIYFINDVVYSKLDSKDILNIIGFQCNSCNKWIIFDPLIHQAEYFEMLKRTIPPREGYLCNNFHLLCWNCHNIKWPFCPICNTDTCTAMNMLYKSDERKLIYDKFDKLNILNLFS